MRKRRLLTKSRFKVGNECPTKLYYLDNDAYGNKKVDDPFLRGLAEGGFQVGELAKIYHAGGVEVTERDKENSARVTNNLLSANSVTIFEAAIRFNDFFVRVDALKKNGRSIELIEVKAKSYDPTSKESFFTKKGSIRSEWEPYLLDIAFQTYVTRKAYPNYEVSSFLMLADKSATASIDGINQRFLIARDQNNRPAIKVRAGTTNENLGAPILCRINVDQAVEYIHNEMFGDLTGWERHLDALANLVTTSRMAEPKVSSNCKSCEFRIDATKLSQKKSGFNECWLTFGVTETEIGKPMVFDIWNFRKSQTLIDNRQYFLHQVAESDINPQKSDGPGITSSQRQWLQVQKSISRDKSPFIDIEGLVTEFSNFKYPLHFIDFETTMTALPFNKGRRPYEQVAFQFSHHVVNRDGSIRHKSQFIHRERGTFPNFTFIRECVFRSIRTAVPLQTGRLFL